jgi:hypothetical protein
LFIIRESVGKHILKTKAIYNQKVELSEYFSLLSLPLVKLLDYYKVLKYLIISLDIYDCIYIS